MKVCESCGYNLPHHERGCKDAPRTVALCPEHAGSLPRIGSDDAKLRCSICSTVGYNVRLFVA